MNLDFQNLHLNLPDDLQKLVHQPEDPANAIMLEKETAQAEILIKVQPVSGDQLMPFDDPQAVVDAIHASVNDRQGLIEVDAGYTVSNKDFIYSIVKSRQSRFIHCQRIFVRIVLFVCGKIRFQISESHFIGDRHFLFTLNH